MRRLFEVLSVFDWITPTIELAHQAKNTPKATVVLERVGIRPKRKPVGFGIVGEYIMVIPYDDLATATSALNMAGVKWHR